MEKDIEILQTFLLADIPEIITQEEFDDVKQSIQNLLNRNKKLEISDMSKEKSSMNYYNLYKEEKATNMELLTRLRSDSFLDRDNYWKDKIRKFIKEELPDDEIMEVCSCYDVNGVSLRRELEKMLKE